LCTASWSIDSGAGRTISAALFGDTPVKSSESGHGKHAGGQPRARYRRIRRMEMRIKTLLAMALLVVAPTALADPPATQPTSQPRSNGWDPSLLFYQRSAPIAVEETTPTADQINFRHRPVVMAADAPEPVPTQGPVKP